MNVVLPYKTYEGFFLRLVKSLEDLIVHVPGTPSLPLEEKVSQYVHLQQLREVGIFGFFEVEALLQQVNRGALVEHAHEAV